MTTREQFVENLIDSELMSPQSLQEFIQQLPADQRPTNGEAMARCLVKAGELTRFQADCVLKRQFDQLTIGQYEVLDRIGAGGMGAVYKARHRRMDRIVAIKTIVQHSLTDQDAEAVVRRFEREVQLISSLQHRNIVIAYDADECETGPFLVMEYVPGDNLNDAVRRDGRMSAYQALNYITQSARGLEYAHQMGVIHRDIKPANLLRVNDTDTFKIADLGLARLQDSEDNGGWRGSLTETGKILGTVLFMSPEQAAGARTIDRRCDIYSLGCTLYYLLKARPPYIGDTRVDTILLHREGPIPALSKSHSKIPETLDAIFQRMVAKSPEDRYQSMSEVITALETCRVESGLQAPQRRIKASSQPIPVDAVTEDFAADPQDEEKQTVLLVEPSSAQAIVIRGFLEALGVNTITHCRTASESLQAVSDSHPDVVICAMHLDDMKGIEFAQRLRQPARDNEMGFILISSSKEVLPLVEQTRGIGVTVLAKPFDQQQLADAIEKSAASRLGAT